MTIHVVCVNDPSHVLGRMALALQQINGWTAGKMPDRRATNLYLPYLNWKRSDRLPAAAYFTHLEVNDRFKAAAWATVDRAVAMRIVTARRYVDHLRRPAKMVRPPIDREHFTPALNCKPLTVRPRIGLSGMTYATGRKGESLIKLLVQNHFAESVEMVASGRGWPGVPTRMYTWAEMPDFYRSLDVLLCTSTVEGVPMPPLEALSCGIPVVIPRDVGLLDDIPNAPGIYRYERGEFAGMVAALRAALFDRQWFWARRENSELLRALTEPYTAANWAADCAAAMEAVSG